MIFCDNNGVSPVQTITATNSTLKTMGTGDQKDGMLFGSLNASYDIDSLNLITTSIGLDRFNSRSSILGGLTTMTQAGGQLWSYNSESVNKSSWNGIEASLDYQHLFKDNKEKMLTFSYQYSGSPMKSNGITTITNPIGTLIPDMKRESISNDGTYQHTAQADFTTPLVAKGSSLSSGVKFMRLSNTANDLFNGQTSKYNFFNNIGAVYTELLLALDKVTLTAGARYEHTWQKVDYDAVGKDFRTNYGSIIPNASLQFNLGPATNVSLAYNLRISRPGIEYLNPYIDRTDPTGLTYGNPDVVPERSHHLSLAYNFANPSWVVSIRLTDDLCANGITSYTFFDKADGLRHTTYGNVNKSNTLGSNIYVNWNAGSKTRLYLFADGGYSTFKSTELDLSNQGWSAGGGLGFQQTLPSDFRISGNIFAQSRSYSLDGWSSGMSFASLGVTKTFFDDHLSLSLQGSSNLGKGKLAFTGHTEGQGIVMDMTQMIPMKDISFTISYTFGKSGVHTRQTERSINNDGILSSGRKSISGSINKGQGNIE